MRDATPNDRGAEPGQESWVTRAWHAGRTAWPRLQVSETRFRAYLIERHPDDNAPEPPAAASGDLYLACACALADPAALAVVEQLIAPAVERLAQRWRHARIDRAELAQALRVRMFVGDGDRPPRIALYRGDGPLKHWLGITAARLIVDLSRQNRRPGQDRLEAADADDALLASITDAEGPELAFLREEYRAAVKAAFARAFAGLTDHERTLLRLRFLDGLQLDEIARVTGVHRVTVSKALARARDRLAAALTDDLGRSLRGDDPEAALALVRSRISLSFERLLRPAT